MTNNSKYREIYRYLVFMKMAEQTSKLSYDPKHIVGSLLVSKDFSNINAIGYNGNYPGGENVRESMESGKSGFIHAEINAIIKSNLTIKERADYNMFITLSPCIECAKVIATAGIKNVIYLNEYYNRIVSEKIISTSGGELISIRNLFLKWFLTTDMVDKLTNIDDELLNIYLMADTKEFFNCIDFDKIYKPTDYKLETTNLKDIITDYSNILFDTVYSLI